MKYYDSVKKQLIYLENKSGNKQGPDFWDDHWQINKDTAVKILETKNTFINFITQEYLKTKDGMILEAGCGKGQNVASLLNNGYRAIGVDYAEKLSKHLINMSPD